MIRFYCACGKRLKVDDALAGRPVQCPDCGAATQAPPAEPEPLSGPEALVAAIKGAAAPAGDDIPVAEVAAGPAEDDIPVAEVVAGPPAGVVADDFPTGPDAAPEAAHLDALARAAAAAPAARPLARTAARPLARPAARRAAPAARGVKVAGTPRRPAAKGRPPRPGQAHRQAALIGALAAIGVIAIVVIIVVIMGNRPGPVDKPPPPPPAAEPVVETPAPPRFTGHQPGEMFDAVPFDDEKPAAEKNAAPGK